MFFENWSPFGHYRDYQIIFIKSFKTYVMNLLLFLLFTIGLFGVDDAAAAAMISAGLSAGATGFNAMSQGNLNKKTRKWNEQMYERQLSDNLMMWDKQNQYNSPVAQMQRLQEAGLNPAQMYGQSGAVGTAGAVSNPGKPDWKPGTPAIDPRVAGGGFETFFNLKQQKAQTDNMNVQNAILTEQVITQKLENEMRKVNLIGEGLDHYDIQDVGKKSSFGSDLKYREVTTRSILKRENLVKQIENLEARSAAFIGQESRSQDLHEGNQILQQLGIQIRGEEADQIQIRTGILQLDKAIRQLDLDMWEAGISRGDELWQRMILRLVKKFGIL